MSKYYAVVLRNGSTTKIEYLVSGQVQASRLRDVLTQTKPELIPPNGYYLYEPPLIDGREIDLLIQELRPEWASFENLVLKDGDGIVYVLCKHANKAALWVDVCDSSSEFTIATIQELMAGCADPKITGWSNS